MHSVEASILVNAPVAMCYRHWLDFERFPEFMSRVVSVKRVDPVELLPPELHSVPKAEDPQKDYDGVMLAEVVNEIAAHGNQVWHWEVKGPFGQLFDWTAGVVLKTPDQAISWASTADQDLPTTGTVNFLKVTHTHTERGSLAPHERTLVTVTMSFSPPVGILGEFIADMTHYGDNLLCEALQDFKTHVELLYAPEIPEPLAAERGDKPMTSEAQLRDALGPAGGAKSART